MASGSDLQLEVVYARADVQVCRQVTVPAGSTVRQAIDASGLLTEFPEILLTKQSVGRYGELTALESEVQPGDRIEIYRPLQVDPRETRRRRAAVRERRSRS